MRENKRNQNEFFIGEIFLSINRNLVLRYATCIGLGIEKTCYFWSSWLMKPMQTLSWKYLNPLKPVFNWTGCRTNLDLGQIISHSRHILPGQRAICWHERNRRSGSNLLPTLLLVVTRNLQWLLSPFYQHLEGRHAVMCTHAWLT